MNQHYTPHKSAYDIRNEIELIRRMSPERTLNRRRYSAIRRHITQRAAFWLLYAVGIALAVLTWFITR